MRRLSNILILAVFLAALTACAAKTPLKKAMVAQDLFISTLETTAKQMPFIEAKYPADKVKEVKKAYMTAKHAVQAYQDALEIWETTDQKPKDLDKLLGLVMRALGDLRILGASVGVKYEQ